MKKYMRVKARTKTTDESARIDVVSAFIDLGCCAGTVLMEVAVEHGRKISSAVLSALGSFFKK